MARRISQNWIDKLLTVQVESGIFAGKRGIMLNLIPEGYVLTNDGGFIVIRPKLEPPPSVARQRSTEEVEEDINLDDVPF